MYTIKLNMFSSNLSQCMHDAYNIYICDCLYIVYMYTRSHCMHDGHAAVFVTIHLVVFLTHNHPAGTEYRSIFTYMSARTCGLITTTDLYCRGLYNTHTYT